MQSAEIRRRFLGFFEDRGHTVVPSASLILDDPTLLFVNAGMVPFKPYFLGQERPPFPRATSVQKCVRTQDIEEVGKTTRHGTFFQMSGNFSFGDYFKEGAVAHAWELITRSQADGGFGIDESKLWVTVYLDDDESIDIWKRVAGLPDDRIVRRGMKDNFWSMGVPGPCGPCSEIYYDRGPEHGPDGGPDVDEDRFLEFWNLVFMQHERGAGPAKEGYPILGDLPAKNIDTGLGQERLAYLLQGKQNMYEIDEVFPVIARAGELSGRAYGRRGGHADDVRMRVVGDHIRSSLMLIGDGVTPSNEGRGYVLRRMIRRAIRSMRLLGVEDRVLPELLPISKDLMRASYPELERQWDRISAVAYAEEESFRQTLRAGTQIFDLAAGETKERGAAVLPGATAFKLHDTFGFPIDLTLEMAAEQGLQVDTEGFRRLMTEQRQRAKADALAKKTGHADVTVYRSIADTMGAPVAFTGYEGTSAEGTVRGIIVGGSAVQSAGAGSDVEIVLDRTPFYAEGGGQLADQGYIEVDGARLEVLDVQSPVNGVIAHRARVVEGEVRLGATALGSVDVERRMAISRSHTATHMVHRAFRDALGETAAQAGSENAPGRFRFDFGATGPVPHSVLRDVEDRVNALISAELQVHAEVMSQADAIRSGAMALFGEKYGERVRVVSVGDFSRELCGGTHARNSGQLGLVSLLGESSIGQGVRRVEAMVGIDAFRFLAREHVLVGQLSGALKVRPEELPERVGGIIEKLRRAEKEIERLRAEQVLGAAAGLAAGAQTVGAVAFVGHQVPVGTTADDARKLVMDVRSRLGESRPAVVMVGAVPEARPVVVVATNQAARDLGVKAGALVRTAARVLGGGGGGKDDLAQGGGQRPEALADALAAVQRDLAALATK